MAERVLLHIGLMKSGTTFLQGRITVNRDVLAEQGILVPGPSWARHARAVADVTGSPHAVPGSWDDLVAEINAHAGPAIVSMEYLAPSSDRLIARIRDDFPGARVEAVMTVRDLGRTVPAMWQEAMKNRKTWSWEDYVRSIRRNGDAGKRFWRQQGAGRIAERWAGGLGADHLHVITLPPPGAASTLLWDRFREVAEIRDAAWAEAPRANESLGVTSALLMQRINEHVTDLGLASYNSRVKSLGKHVLPLRRQEEPAIGFTVPKWLVRRAEEMVGRIARTGAHVVGNLAELTPLDVPGTDPSAVDTDAQLDVAVQTLAVLLRAGASNRKGVRRVHRQADQRSRVQSL